MDARKATRSGQHAQNGLTIWRARKRKGMTQEQLAAASGVSRIQMIKLENGMHLPKRETRDRMAEALGLQSGKIKCEQEAALPGEPFRTRSLREPAASHPGRDRSGAESVTEDAA